MNLTGEAPAIRIAPSKGWTSLKLNELWQYRELLFFLVWRDVKVRYKQTVLGVGWAILQPFFTMVIFSLFFGRLAKMPSDGVPYPIFSFTALIPWMFFANGLNQSANSLVSNSNLINKVYFPRLAIPIASVLAGLADFIPSFIILIGMMLYFGIYPTATMAWIPLFLLLALITSLGVGIGLAAVNVKYRDVRHTVPFLVQCWLFATPIAYPSSLLPPAWQTIYALNPMVGVVEGFRWALLGADTHPGPMVAVSTVVALAVLAGAALYFRRMERSFADVI
jgi:lipopolysaccharide transport system permease protein